MPCKTGHSETFPDFSDEDMTWPCLGCFFCWSLRKLNTQTRIDRLNDQKKKLYILGFHFFLSCHSVQFVLIWKQLFEYCNFPWDKNKNKILAFLSFYLFLLWSCVISEKQCFIKLLCEYWSSKLSCHIQQCVNVKACSSTLIAAKIIYYLPRKQK